MLSEVQTVKSLELKRVPVKVDRVGGVGSILAGLGCAYIGWGDYSEEHSIYKVWAIFCVVLILNGIAMLIHARGTEKLTRT